MLEFALKYASKNWYVIPCYPIRGGICACGRPQCVSPGKHPANLDGLKGATTNEAQIRKWWTDMPDANIGVVMETSNLLALDLDNYHGDLEKVAELEQNLGPLPATVTQRSGSGDGFHVLFQSPGFPVRGVIGGIVVRSKAYIIVAPSNHISGGHYAWQEGLGPTEIALAELPDRWKDALKKSASVGKVGIPDEEPPWLVAIPQEQRIADMKAHFDNTPGEIKGTSLAGTSFNVVRSAIRSHAVCDPEAALEAAMVWDAKCVPPWGARMARHVWSAFERAREPVWGESYRGEEQRLQELGLDKVPVIPAPTPLAPPKPGAIIGALKDIKAKRSTKNFDKDLIDKVLLKTFLQDCEEETAEMLVRCCPPGTTDDQISALLQGCMVNEDRANLLVKEARPKPQTTTPVGMLLSSIPATIFADPQAVVDVNPLLSEHDLQLQGTLKFDAEGEGIKNSPNNLFEILDKDSELGGNIKFNELTKQVEINAPHLKDGSNTLATAVMNWMDKKWQLVANRTQIEDQLLLIARRNQYNPIADYLNTIEWDGIPRIDSWLADYCGADDTEFNRRIGAMWLISACARGIEPGSKVDTILVLEGIQGAKKSKSLSVLGGAWFSDSPLVIGNKDSMQMASYRWIIELAELSSLRASETEAQKAFISARIDNYRPPYGKAPEEFKRFAVFGGSTNEDEYLPDATGNRRYWPVKVRKCDTLKLLADRDQLWAEATYRYKHADLNLSYAHPECPGERWWFETEAEQDMAAAEVDKRRPENSWTNMIREWARRGLSGPNIRRQWTLAEIAKSCLGIEIEKLPKLQKGITVAIKGAGLTPAVGDAGQPMWRLADSVMPDTEESSTEGLRDSN